MVTGNPLVLLQYMPHDELRLLTCPVGLREDGSAIGLDVLDPWQFGRSILSASATAIRWLATTPFPDVRTLRELYPFHFGAVVSPRVRQLIEEIGAVDVEFIPLTILWEGSGQPIGEWWFVNVFCWRDVFDYSRSRLEYTEFSEELDPWQARSAEFGRAAITEIHELVATPEAFAGGLFLARGSSTAIWSRVFVGTELARRINDGVPPERQVHFQEFLLTGRPQPPRVPRVGPSRRKWRWLPW